MSDIISKATLLQLVDGWIGQKRQAVGPVRTESGQVYYQPISASGELMLDGFIRPRNTIKEFFFPRHEKLYGYKFEGKEIHLTEAVLPAQEQLIVGARPCDSASLPILDRVFNWDYQDAFYNQRRENTTIVTLACKEHDRYCFCTTVDLAPDAPQGSDVLLYDLGGGEFEVRCQTEKGRKLMAGKTQTSEKVGKAAEPPKNLINLEKAGEFLSNGFESPEWKTMSLRCLGCGACSFNCPTCHCFDIADEGVASGGDRVRNWDSCQFGLYSLHASGHNPRDIQSKRQRQRIFHKFQTYPEKFGHLLCTGCGNCSRLCPVSLGVRPILEIIGKPE